MTFEMRRLATTLWIGRIVLVLFFAELVDMVQESLRRGFTPLECERYGFEEDCPDVSELQGVTAASPVAPVTARSGVPGG